LVGLVEEEGQIFEGDEPKNGGGCLANKEDHDQPHQHQGHVVAQVVGPEVETGALTGHRVLWVVVQAGLT